MAENLLVFRDPYIVYSSFPFTGVALISKGSHEVQEIMIPGPLVCIAETESSISLILKGEIVQVAKENAKIRSSISLGKKISFGTAASEKDFVFGVSEDRLGISLAKVGERSLSSLFESEASFEWNLIEESSCFESLFVDSSSSEEIDLVVLLSFPKTSSKVLQFYKLSLAKRELVDSKVLQSLSQSSSVLKINEKTIGVCDVFDAGDSDLRKISVKSLSIRGEVISRVDYPGVDFRIIGNSNAKIVIYSPDAREILLDADQGRTEDDFGGFSIPRSCDFAVLDGNSVVCSNEHGVVELRNKKSKILLKNENEENENDVHLINTQGDFRVVKRNNVEGLASVRTCRLSSFDLFEHGFDFSFEANSCVESNSRIFLLDSRSSTIQEFEFLEKENVLAQLSGPEYSDQFDARRYHLFKHPPPIIDSQDGEKEFLCFYSEDKAYYVSRTNDRLSFFKNRQRTSSLKTNPEDDCFFLSPEFFCLHSPSKSTLVFHFLYQSSSIDFFSFPVSSISQFSVWRNLVVFVENEETFHIARVDFNLQRVNTSKLETKLARRFFISASESELIVSFFIGNSLMIACLKNPSEFEKLADISFYEATSHPSLSNSKVRMIFRSGDHIMIFTNQNLIVSFPHPQLKTLSSFQISSQTKKFELLQMKETIVLKEYHSNQIKFSVFDSSGSRVRQMSSRITSPDDNFSLVAFDSDASDEALVWSSAERGLFYFRQEEPKEVFVDSEAQACSIWPTDFGLTVCHLSLQAISRIVLLQRSKILKKIDLKSLERVEKIRVEKTMNEIFLQVQFPSSLSLFVVRQLPDSSLVVKKALVDKQTANQLLSACGKIYTVIRSSKGEASFSELSIDELEDLAEEKKPFNELLVSVQDKVFLVDPATSHVRQLYREGRVR